MSASDDVVEAMALALFDDHAERMGFGYRSEHLDARGRKIAIETWKPRIFIAIRAVHERGGLVVGKMPETMVWLMPSALSPEEEAYDVGWNAALAAVRAAAVEVEG